MSPVSRKSIKIAAAMLGTTALTSAIAPAAQAQSQEVRTYKVAAQPLTSAAAQLSEQAGIQLVVDSSIGSGVRSGAVDGRMTSTEALQLMLAGTGLTWRSLGNGTITIEKPADVADGERVLGVVSVEGSQGGSYATPVRGDGVAQLGGIRGGQDEEAVGYRAKVASVTTGTPVALENIPRSITVQTQDLIEKQNITNVQEALERLPGVTVLNNADPIAPSQFSVRGQNVTKFQVDGEAPRSLGAMGNSIMSLDAYERVELVRGPNAISVGENSAGGSVNLVRKRPGSLPAQSIQIEGGNHNNYGAIFDLSTPSLFGTSIAFRTVGSMRNQGGAVDDFSTRTYTFYAIADAPLGDSARLEAGYNYSRSKVDGQYLGGIRSVSGNLLDLGDRFNIPAPGLYASNETHEVFVKGYVDVAEDWDFELGATYQTNTAKMRRAVLTQSFYDDGSVVNPSSPFFGNLLIQEQEELPPNTLSLNSKLTGRFNTFGIEHNVFAALNVISSDERDYNDNLGSVKSVALINDATDLLDPVYDAYPPAFIYSGMLVSANNRRSASIILSDTISWRDKIFLTGTIRKDNTESSSIIVRGTGFTPDELPVLFFSATDLVSKTVWSPSYSLLVKPTTNISIFASYADGFIRQDNSFSRSGDAPNYVYTSLPPSEFQNIEGGIKFATDKWLGSISAYRMRETGVAMADGDLMACPQGPTFPQPQYQCFLSAGGSQTSKGLDVEFSGRVAPGLSAVLSYNYNKITRTSPLGTPPQSLAPMSSAKAFVEWIPQFNNNISLQLSASYKGRYFASGTRDIFGPDGPPVPIIADQPYEIEQKPYVLVDVGLDYKINKNLTARLFVENVTDKTYFATPSQATIGSYYGRPRTFMASLKWSNIGAPSDGGGGYAPFGQAPDWYAGLDGGLNLQDDVRATAEGKAQDETSDVTWDFNTTTGKTFAARLGYFFTDNMSFELEGRYRGSKIKTIGGAAVAPFGVCGAVGATNGGDFDCDDVGGKFQNWSLMGNVAYWFGKRDALIRPFVGAGVGLSRNSVNFQGKMLGIGGDGPWYDAYLGDWDGNPATPDTYIYAPSEGRQMQEQVAGVSTKVGIAWQLFAGASLKINKRLRAEVGYRFVNIPKMTWSTYNLDRPTLFGFGPGPLTPRLGEFEAKSRSSLVTLGFTWAFGGSE